MELSPVTFLDIQQGSWNQLVYSSLLRVNLPGSMEPPLQGNAINMSTRKVPFFVRDVLFHVLVRITAGPFLWLVSGEKGNIVVCWIGVQSDMVISEWVVILLAVVYGYFM